MEEYKAFTKPVEAYKVETEEVVTEPQEVRIKVVIDWNEERIIKEINEVFPDAPVMVHVARCESSYKSDAFNPTNDSNDKGLFQISTFYHEEEVESLGLDMFNIQDNIAFARILYDRSGLGPWKWSKSCWSKYL